MDSPVPTSPGYRSGYEPDRWPGIVTAFATRARAQPGELASAAPRRRRPRIPFMIDTVAAGRLLSVRAHMNGVRIWSVVVVRLVVVRLVIVIRLVVVRLVIVIRLV